MDATCGDWGGKVVAFPGAKAATDDGPAEPLMAEHAAPVAAPALPPMDDVIAWGPNRGVFIFAAGSEPHPRALDAIGRVERHRQLRRPRLRLTDPQAYALAGAMVAVGVSLAICVAAGVLRIGQCMPIRFSPMTTRFRSEG